MKVKKTRQISGFSLIELMVVVAIIGILATVAVPQFNRFSSKAKQSEAKVALGAIYSVERAYQIESGSFSSCLQAIGFSPEAGQKRYSVGFAAGGFNEVGTVRCAAAVANGMHFFQPGIAPLLAANVIVAPGSIPAAGAAGLNQPAAPALPVAGVNTSGPAAVTAGAGAAAGTADQFIAAAAGVIRNGAPANDRWTINHNQVLVNTANNL